MIFLFFLNFSMFFLCFCFIKYNSRINLNRIASSALNPFYFVLFLNLFFLADFYFLYEIPVIEMFEYQFFISKNDVYSAFQIFTLFNAVLIISIMVTHFFSIGLRKNEIVVLNLNSVDLVFKLIVSLVMIVLFFNFNKFFQMISGEVSRQVLFSSNQYLHVAFSLVIPSFVFYLAYNSRNLKKVAGAFLISFLLVLITGSRGNLLLLVIILAILFILNFKVIRPIFLFISIPFVGLILLITRYYFRESWRYNSIFEFIDDNAGVGHVFFSTSEISMADVLVTINVWKEQIERFPFESFLAGLMYPLPRAIFTFKPLGSGGTLTELLSPVRWELTRSELVTTGYGDLLMQFGVAGGLLVFAILCFIWGLCVRKVMLLSNENIIIFLPFLIWWPYIFIRADIFNMFSSIWSFSLVLFITIFVKRHLRGKS